MGTIRWNTQGGGLPIRVSDTAPAPVDGDKILVKKGAGGELREATLTQMGHVFLREVTITEAAGGAAQTYTASVSVPAGAYILDVVVHAVAVWDDGTAATMKVGTSTPDDDNGYFTGINLLITDLLAGEYLRSSDISGWGGKEGVYLTAAGLQTSYSATARVVTFIVNTTDGDGTAGRTRCYVLYAVPQSVTAATQAAT
jgi:hypothetical protein